MMRKASVSLCDRSYLEKGEKGLAEPAADRRAGTGIAFTIPMSSIGGKRELGFLIQGQEFVREEEGTLKETKHELIVQLPITDITPR